jgi:hypothetical protein
MDLLSGLDVEEFVVPPVVMDDRRNVRRAGFELEFAGLDLRRTASLVQQVFGGQIESVSTFIYRVTGTEFGDFSVEIDADLLKNKRYESVLRAIGLDPAKLDTRWIENALLSVASAFVPVEIGAPPMPVDQLDKLDELRGRLCDHQARGTRASLIYAFGLHINPQVSTLDVSTLLNHLRAFLLLYAWIERRVEADVARRISPYINPFPREYARLILREEYTPDAARFVNDYLAYNPTRNRPLDMLPVLGCLDRNRVNAVAKDHKLVKPRPAFHYRMPNCLVDEPLWRISREWNTWIAVERLANDPVMISTLSRTYFDSERDLLRIVSNAS